MKMHSAPTSPVTKRWVTAILLEALAKHYIVEGGMVTADQLADWTASHLTPDQRVHASTRMCSLGFFAHKVRVIGGNRVDTYTVTHDGAVAIEAAAAGYQRKSGPKDSRAPNPVRPEALSTRLWQLVRLRRIVDSDTAARTLCTAGEEEFERVRATVRKTLRRWKLAGALEEGAKRVKAHGEPATSNGSKRYVLVKDIGPTPPAWRPALRQQAASKGAAK